MNYIEFIRLGILGIKEILCFARDNSTSVNVQATANEIEGKLYAIEGYTEKIKLENDDLKVCVIKQEMRADRAEQRAKELEKEVEGLQQYFKGE